MTTDTAIIPNTTDPSKPLVMVNVHSVQKLTPSNYLIWKAQVSSLLIGYDLHQFIDGSTPCPPPKLLVNGESTLNPAHVIHVILVLLIKAINFRLENHLLLPTFR